MWHKIYFSNMCVRYYILYEILYNSNKWGTDFTDAVTQLTFINRQLSLEKELTKINDTIRNCEIKGQTFTKF